MVKTTGLKFQLCEKTYLMANGVKKQQPYYSLTKTECLYIATKFNDEARAKGGGSVVFVFTMKWANSDESRDFRDEIGSPAYSCVNN